MYASRGPLKADVIALTGLNPCERRGVADEFANDPGVGGLAVVAVGEDDESGLGVGLNPTEVFEARAVAPTEPRLTS